MAKTDAPDLKSVPGTAAALAAKFDGPPRLGAEITVCVADGLVLVNNETGQDFAPGMPTAQTVTVTTLRRLQDGDLVRLA